MNDPYANLPMPVQHADPDALPFDEAPDSNEEWSQV